MDLMKSFAGAVGYNVRGPSSPASAVSASPQVSMLQALAPNLNVSVSFNNLDNHRVDAGKNNAAALVGPNINKVATVQQDIGVAKNAIAETIRQAQREVAAAAKVEGHSAASLYPDKRIAAEGETGIFAQMAMQGASGMAGVNGMGSFITALNNTSTFDTFMDDRKGSGVQNKAAVEATIRDRLIASSQRPVDTRNKVASFQEIVDGQIDQGPEASGLDWEAFFEQGHSLDDLMAIDPDNPTLGQVPEFDQLDIAENDAAQVMGSLKATRETLAKDGQVTDAGAVTLACESFEGMNGVIADRAPPKSEAYASVRQTLEPDLEKLGLKPSAPALQSGGMAA